MNGDEVDKEKSPQKRGRVFGLCMVALHASPVIFAILYILVLRPYVSKELAFPVEASIVFLFVGIITLVAAVIRKRISR